VGRLGLAGEHADDEAGRSDHQERAWEGRTTIPPDNRQRCEDAQRRDALQIDAAAIIEQSPALCPHTDRVCRSARDMPFLSVHGCGTA
jgi:hypothetical protein